MPGPPEVSPDGRLPLFNGNLDPLSPYVIGGPGAPFETLPGDTTPPRTFYVSAGGSDAADGLTPATAWATVAKVNSSQASFLPGDYILFRRGDTFTGTMLYITTAGNDGRPITYGAYGAGARPIINMTTNSSIYVDNIGGVGITSITVTGGGTSFTSFGGITYFTNTGRKNNIFIEDCDVSGFQHGISIGGSTGTDGYNGVRVNNCDLHDNRDTGMFMYGPTFSAGVFSHRNVAVSNSRAYSNLGNASNTTSHSGSGILLGSVNGGLIDQCTAYSNGANNAYVNGGPAGLWCYDSNNVTIQRSLSYSNRSGTGADGDGFDLDINVSNSTVQYCLAYDNHGAGVLAWARTTGTDWTGNTIRYNLLVSNGRGTSGGFYGEIAMGGNLNNSRIYQNTCISKDLGGTSVPAFSIGTATPVGLLLWNNIFYSNGASPILNTTTAHASTGVLFQGNDYYRPSGMSLKWGATTYTSLANWRTAVANQEQVSAVNTGYTVDPVFFQPTTTPTITDAKDLGYYFDLVLQTSSPVRGAGLNLLTTFGVNPGPRDYYGNALTVPSSIGAVEVDVPPILEDVSAPPVATGTGTGPITTAAFSPPANVLLVALVAGGYGNSPNAPTATITDSLGGTWTKRPEAVNSGTPSFYGGVSIWYRYLATAPGSMSVTGTFLNLSGGKLLRVLVLTGAKPDQTGSGQAVNAINTATTNWTAPITTTVTGSVVYGICDDPVTADAITAATGTVLVGSAFLDSTDGITVAVGKSVAPTGTPGVATLGFTNAASQTGVVALLEILPVSTTTFTQTLTDSTGLTDVFDKVSSGGVTWVAGTFRVRTSTLRGGNTLRSTGGATAFTQSPIDSAGLTDTEGTTESQGPIDSAGLTDTVLKSVLQGNVDSSGLTDTEGTVLSSVTADSAGLTDTAIVTPEHGISQVDSAGLTDTEGTTESQGPVDSAGLTDTFLKSVQQAQVDSAGLTDVSLVEKAVFVTQIDSVGLTDNEGTGLNQNVIDIAGLTDAESSVRSFVPVDLAGLTDTALVESGRLLSQIDSAGLTDTNTFSRILDTQDSAGLTDTTGTVESDVRADSVGLTDVSSVGIERTVASIDSAGLTDTNLKSVFQGPVDSTGLTDTTPVSRTIVFIDSSGLTDNVTDTVSLAPVDSAGLTDTVVKSVIQGTVDSSGLTDTAADARTLVFVDAAGLTDTPSDVLTHVIQDNAGLTDTYQTNTSIPNPASLFAFWSSIHSYATY